MGSSWLKTICYVRLLASGILNCSSVNTRLSFSDRNVGRLTFHLQNKASDKNNLKTLGLIWLTGPEASVLMQGCGSAEHLIHGSGEAGWGGVTWDRWLSLSHIYFTQPCRPLHYTPIFRDVLPSSRNNSIWKCHRAYLEVYFTSLPVTTKSKQLAINIELHNIYTYIL